MLNNTNPEPELDMAPLQRFSQAEINLLLQIISRAGNANNGVVTIEFAQLEELSNYKTSATGPFITDLENAFDRLMDLNLKTSDPSGLFIGKFKMFTAYEINAAAGEPYVAIHGHEKAIPLVSGLDQWIQNSLQAFLELNSGYSRTMFRLLKKQSQTGSVYFSKNEFTQLLSIPRSYKQGDIDRSVLAPIEEELAPLFKGLRIQKEYGRARGKPVTGYQFTFEADS